MSIGGSDQGEKVKVNLSLNLTMEMVEILISSKRSMEQHHEGEL